MTDDERPPIPSSAQLVRQWDDECLRYRRALERILELAERSDAHPELPIADIAREGLGK